MERREVVISVTEYKPILPVRNLLLLAVIILLLTVVDLEQKLGSESCKKEGMRRIRCGGKNTRKLEKMTPASGAPII
jgi:hypothetical protein